MSIRKTQHGTYEVHYRDSMGKQRSKSFKKRTEADRFERETKTAKDKGALIDPDKGNMRVEDFFNDVFVPTRQVAQSTKTIWQRLWGTVDPANARLHHVGEKWGKLRLRDANNREAVLAWHNEMTLDGSSEAKVFQAHGLLVSIIMHAVDLEYLDRSRVSGIQPYYEPKDTGNPWLPADIEKIRADLFYRALRPPQGYGGALRELHRWRRERDAIAVGAMGYAAFRLGECFALQWPMLLDESGKGIRKYLDVTSRIPNAAGDPEDRTKTSRTRRTPRAMRKPRIVELEDALRRDLRWWWMRNGQPADGYVFPASLDGERFETTMFANWGRDVFAKSVKNAGLPKRPPKHLRMSCVSMWIRERRDEGTVADMAGHSVAVMWSTYRKAFLARMEADHVFDMSAAIEAARKGSRTEREAPGDDLPQASNS